MPLHLSPWAQALGAMAATLLMLLAVAPARAQVTDSYCTVISDTDKRASDGFELTDAASILRQDRANYHKFGDRDEGDGPDSSFRSARARERIPPMLDAGGTESTVLEDIVYGYPEICVDIYGTRRIEVYLGPASGSDDMGDAAPASYPFVGTWDCEVGTFTFTETTYDTGGDVLAMEEIQEGSDGSYTLMFSDGYMITLSGFTGDGMGWFSPESGDSFNCTRLG